MTKDAKLTLNRRAILAGLAVAPLVANTATFAQSPAPAVDRSLTALEDAEGTKLVLLGTAAGPGPGRPRQQTAHALISGDNAYIVDFGLGVTNQFAKTGIPFSKVRSLFLTHHHADHNVELGPLLVTGWIRGLPLDVKAYGPPPLALMTSSILEAYRDTIDHWAEDMHLDPLQAVEVSEITGSTEVMSDGTVTVRSLVTQHANMEVSLAYRFDFTDRSIVFSGDTVTFDEMAEFAAGADVLVHAAMYEQAVAENTRMRVERGDNIDYDAQMAHMMASHTPTEQVGRIAQEAGVGLLVLSHLTPLGIDDETWRSAAAQNFSGEIVVGSDLTVI